MINVTLNGEAREMSESLTLSAAMGSWSYQGDSFAVAINEKFVPRSKYAQTEINNGDSIEVVSPLEGG